MTDEELRILGWKPFSEPIVLPSNGESIAWIEHEGWYKLLGDEECSKLSF